MYRTMPATRLDVMFRRIHTIGDYLQETSASTCILQPCGGGRQDRKLQKVGGCAMQVTPLSYTLIVRPHTRWCWCGSIMTLKRDCSHENVQRKKMGVDLSVLVLPIYIIGSPSIRWGVEGVVLQNALEPLWRSSNLAIGQPQPYTLRLGQL